jgi:hypothetical protein
VPRGVRHRADGHLPRPGGRFALVAGVVRGLGDFRVRPIETIEAGEGVVVVPVHQGAKGKERA